MKPSCETCPGRKYKCCGEGLIYCEILQSTQDERQVGLTGCISNPKARGYLMSDVLKELEMRKVRTPSHTYIDDDDYPGALTGTPNPIIKVYEEAIALIRNGVDEE